MNISKTDSSGSDLSSSIGWVNIQGFPFGIIRASNRGEFSNFIVGASVTDNTTYFSVDLVYQSGTLSALTDDKAYNVVPTPPFQLNQLIDVTTSSEASGDLIFRNAGNTGYENRQPVTTDITNINNSASQKLDGTILRYDLGSDTYFHRPSGEHGRVYQTKVPQPTEGVSDQSGRIYWSNPTLKIHQEDRMFGVADTNLATLSIGTRVTLSDADDHNDYVIGTINSAPTLIAVDNLYQYTLANITTLGSLVNNAIINFTYEPNPASGETNTMSSVGTGGTSVYKQKTGVNFEMNSIQAGTGIGVSLDAGNNEIDIDLNAGLNDLTDVTLTAVASGQVLVRNVGNTAFENQAPPAGPHEIVSDTHTDANFITTYDSLDTDLAPVCRYKNSDLTAVATWTPSIGTGAVTINTGTTLDTGMGTLNRNGVHINVSNGKYEVSHNTIGYTSNTGCCVIYAIEDYVRVSAGLTFVCIESGTTNVNWGSPTSDRIASTTDATPRLNISPLDQSPLAGETFNGTPGSDLPGNSNGAISIVAFNVDNVTQTITMYLDGVVIVNSNYTASILPNGLGFSYWGQPNARPETQTMKIGEMIYFDKTLDAGTIGNIQSILYDRFNGTGLLQDRNALMYDGGGSQWIPRNITLDDVAGLTEALAVDRNIYGACWVQGNGLGIPSVSGRYEWKSSGSLFEINYIDNDGNDQTNFLKSLTYQDHVINRSHVLLREITDASRYAHLRISRSTTFSDQTTFARFNNMEVIFDSGIVDGSNEGRTFHVTFLADIPNHWGRLSFVGSGSKTIGATLTKIPLSSTFGGSNTNFLDNGGSTDRIRFVPSGYPSVDLKLDLSISFAQVGAVAQLFTIAIIKNGVAGTPLAVLQRNTTNNSFGSASLTWVDALPAQNDYYEIFASCPAGTIDVYSMYFTATKI